jgi:hypothetical protein
MSSTAVKIYNDSGSNLYIMTKEKPFKYTIIPSHFLTILDPVTKGEKIDLSLYEFKIWDETDFHDVFLEHREDIIVASLLLHKSLAEEDYRRFSF